MVEAASCPTQDELIRLTHGDLPGGRLESVCDHVEVCEKCQDSLSLIEDPPDTFAKQLAGISLDDLENARAAIEADTLKGAASSTWEIFAPLTELKYRPLTLTVPCQLGQYEVLRLIAHGGMGEVYEGRHVRLKRPVAVKVIRGFRQDDPVSHEHFLKEMETAGQLEHPNLVRSYDAWEHDGCLFLAQELLDGDSLQTLVNRGQIKTPGEIVDALLGTCRALEQLHNKDFVHRDVKPSNIMRLTDGTIKLIDYGLAIAFDSGKSAGRVGAGTVGYMSPEQGFGSGIVDNRSDIYSAGRVLKYLLSKLPEVFGDEKQAELVQQLAALAERLTQRKRRDRLQSVYAVIVQLEQFQKPDEPMDTRPETQSRASPTPLAEHAETTQEATSSKQDAAPAAESQTSSILGGLGCLAVIALFPALLGTSIYQIVFGNPQATVLVENHQPGDVIRLTSDDGSVQDIVLGDQAQFVVDLGTYDLSLKGNDSRRLNPANITVTGENQLTVRIEDRPGLGPVLSGIELAEARLNEATRRLTDEKQKLTGFAGDLGEAAFAGLLAGELPDHPVFAGRKELQARIDSLQRQKTKMLAGAGAGMMEMAKLQALQLKLTGQIKIEELQIGSADRALGMAILTSTEDLAVRCSQTETVLNAISDQRNKVESALDKVKYAEATVTRQKSAAADAQKNLRETPAIE